MAENQPQTSEPPARRSRPLRILFWCVIGPAVCAAIGWQCVSWWYVRSRAPHALQEARWALEDKDADKAREELVWLQRFDSGHPELLFVNGMAAHIQEDFTSSIQMFRSALAEIDDTESQKKLVREIKIALGATLLMDSRFDSAEEVFRDCLEDDEFDDKARSQLKWILTKELRRDEVVKQLHRRLELLPDDLSVLPDLVIAYELGTFTDCANYLQQIHDVRPDQPPVMLSLGYSYFQLGDYERAIPLLEKSLELAPEMPLAIVWMSESLIDRGMLDDAETLLDSYSSEPSPEFWRIKSLLLERQQKYEESLSAIEQILTKTPNHLVGLNNKARLLQRLGRLDDVAELRKRAVRVSKIEQQFGSRAMILRKEPPTVEDCQTIIGLYEELGDEELVEGWRIIERNVAIATERILRTGPDPTFDYNQVFQRTMSE